MSDRLSLYINLRWRGMEWMLSAAGITNKRQRLDVAHVIGRDGLAAWIQGLDEAAVQRIEGALRSDAATQIDAYSGHPDTVQSTPEIMMRVFDRALPDGERESLDVSLTSVGDLEVLMDFLRRAKWPTYLRGLEKVQAGKEWIWVYEGDVIQAGTRSSWDRLKTVLAVSDEGVPWSGHLYRELIWSESHGFLTGDKRLNLDLEHGYNYHVFTMQDGWKVLGNVHISRRLLLPPAAVEPSV